VRLSPKSIFFGIVALGLPFAVAVGWTLGTPAATNATISAPGGSGTIGAAPARADTSPLAGVDYSSKPPRTGGGSAAAAMSPAVVSPSSAAPTASVTISLAPLPVLTDPPVPTPTTVTSEPPSPSATPSGSATPAPKGFDAARLVRKS
jgi:hypothetical protein